MFSSIFVAFVFTASALASPWADKCTPNAMGEAIAILGPNRVTIDNVNTFFVQQDGQDPTSFLIKDPSNPNRALTAYGEHLSFQQASDSGNEPWQLFKIHCNVCSPTSEGIVGKQCTIQSKLDNLCLDPYGGSLQQCGDASQVLTLVNAKSLEWHDVHARETTECAPNFEGIPAQVVASDNVRLTVGGINAFLIQQDGQDPTNFILKDPAHPNKAVTVGQHGTDLVLAEASNAGNQSNQLFKIACNKCSPVTAFNNEIGDVCTFVSKDNGLCLDAWNGFTLQHCNGGAGQQFDLDLYRH